MGLKGNSSKDKCAADHGFIVNVKHLHPNVNYL